MNTQNYHRADVRKVLMSDFFGALVHVKPTNRVVSLSRRSVSRREQPEQRARVYAGDRIGSAVMDDDEFWRKSIVALHFFVVSSWLSFLNFIYLLLHLFESIQ